MAAFELCADGLVRLLINKAETLALGTNFLRKCCLATPFMISHIQMSYTFQATGHGPQSLLLSSCRQNIMMLPMLFLMQSIFGLYGVVCAQLLADGITLVISFALHRQLIRHTKQPAGQIAAQP